jgi:hypothetical protein
MAPRPSATGTQTGTQTVRLACSLTLERFFSDVAEFRYDLSLDDAIREFQC